MSSKETEASHDLPVAKRSPIYTLALATVLFVFWLLWSGHFGDPLLLGFGVFSCLVVVLLSRRMNIVDDEGAPVQLGIRPFRYAPWLIKEIVLANIDVAKRILHPRLPIQPGMIRVKAMQKSDLAKVIFANSITLTPGTVSVDMQDDIVSVHALTADDAAEDASGDMNRRVAKLERSP